MTTINMNNIARSLLLLSDTHVWSDYALVSREPVYNQDRRHLNPPETLSDGQKVIQSYWYEKMLPTADKFNVDAVIHLSDAVQGANPREGGISSISPDIDYQKDDFVNLMKPLVTGRDYHQFSGTLYHEALNVRIHKDLTDKLRPYCNKARFHNKFANLRIKGTSKVMNCAHAATSALIYPATIIDREITFAKVAVAEGRIPKPNYIVRGHLHKYIHLDYVDTHGIQLPGWQAWYPLGDKVRLYGRTQPDIGFCILLIDKQDRTILMHFCYPTPNILDFEREI